MFPCDNGFQVVCACVTRWSGLPVLPWERGRGGGKNAGAFDLDRKLLIWKVVFGWYCGLLLYHLLRARVVDVQSYGYSALADRLLFV